MEKHERQNIVYLDWAATSPLRKEALDAMLCILEDTSLDKGAANPNSLHGAGRHAFALLEQSRADTARMLGVKPPEITFTSSATESNNLAILGMARGIKYAGKTPVVYLGATEHPSVLRCSKELKAQGIECIEIPCDGQGFANPQALAHAIEQKKAFGIKNFVPFVSVQLVNSETGCIQPVGECAKIVHASNGYIHTDITQALGHVEVDLRALDVDAASLSSHKVGGPKGVGALYVRLKTPFYSMSFGGGQESGKRSGTQNVTGIVGFVRALQISIERLPLTIQHLNALRKHLIQGLKPLDKVRLTCDYEGNPSMFSPHVVNMLMKGFESQACVARFDEKSIEVSGGSACSESSNEISHVLRAMGVPRNDALGELRVSLGYSTTLCDIDAFLDALKDMLLNDD